MPFARPKMALQCNFSDHQYFLTINYHLANLYPKLLANGKLEDKQLNFIVMPKYDVDLERLFQMQRRRFKLETVITVGIQMVERLETMHNCGLVHNDLKP
jgi:serine/threonine protein kinase